jgi:transposase-like protein
MIVMTTTKTLQTIIDEGYAITKRFRSKPRCQGKEPNAVARLIELQEESGLSVHEFARRTMCNPGTMYMWKKGQTTSGDDWPALRATITKRTGANLSALMNEELPSQTQQTYQDEVIALANAMKACGR